MCWPMRHPLLRHSVHIVICECKNEDTGHCRRRWGHTYTSTLDTASLQVYSFDLGAQRGSPGPQRPPQQQRLPACSLRICPYTLPLYMHPTHFKESSVQSHSHTGRLSHFVGQILNVTVFSDLRQLFTVKVAAVASVHDGIVL